MKPKSILAILVLLLIFLGITYMWPFKNKSSLPKTVETKTFSDSTYNELLTFEYPNPITKPAIVAVKISKVEIINKGSRSERSLYHTNVIADNGFGALAYYRPELFTHYSQNDSAKAGESYLVAAYIAEFAPAFTIIEMVPINESDAAQAVALAGQELQGRKNSQKVLQTKTFSCPGMEGFTFEYPVFEGWKYSEPRIIDRNKECSIDLINPSGKSKDNDLPLRIAVIKATGLERKDSVTPSLPKNPQGIYYVSSDPKNTLAAVTFSTNFSVDIQAYGGEGFDRDFFIQTVINSFRVIPEADKKI